MADSGEQQKMISSKMSYNIIGNDTSKFHIRTFLQNVFEHYSTEFDLNLSQKPQPNLLKLATFNILL